MKMKFVFSTFGFLVAIAPHTHATDIFDLNYAPTNGIGGNTVVHYNESDEESDSKQLTRSLEDLYIGSTIEREPEEVKDQERVKKQVSFAENVDVLRFNNRIPKHTRDKFGGFYYDDFLENEGKEASTVPLEEKLPMAVKRKAKTENKSRRLLPDVESYQKEMGTLVAEAKLYEQKFRILQGESATDLMFAGQNYVKAARFILGANGYLDIDAKTIDLNRNKYLTLTIEAIRCYAQAAEFIIVNGKYPTNLHQICDCLIKQAHCLMQAENLTEKQYDVCMGQVITVKLLLDSKPIAIRFPKDNIDDREAIMHDIDETIRTMDINKK
jgi:hypothetical protein